MRICKIEGCNKKHAGRGWCYMHHRRWLRHGDPLFRKSLYEKHGMTHTHEYQIWTGMKVRCYDPKFKAYHRYGGRGITICDRWLHSFLAFYNDMGSKPFPNAQIDRIDNDGNYEPDNCHWVSASENMRNKSTNKFTEAEVGRLRIRYAQGGIKQRELAKEYEVKQQYISDIILYKRWK